MLRVIGFVTQCLFPLKPPLSRGALRPRGQSGMTIVEIAVGIAVLALVSATALTSVTSLNRNAVSTRVMENAREVVQGDIETAIGTPFSTTSIPSAWAIGTTTSTPLIYSSRNDKTVGAITGTMTHVVTAEANTLGGNIRRLKTTLSYTLFKRNFTYDMTTLRASDP
jgi:type II secretory pathway pseudopilin PulG